MKKKEGEPYKRFMVWESKHYYPGLGLSDFIYSFDTLEDAVNYVKTLSKDRGIDCGIFDRIEGVEVGR